MDEVHILELPDKLLEDILSGARYEDLVRLRAVCTRFSEVCERLLNGGFLRLESTLRFQLDNLQSQVGSSLSSSAVIRVLSRYKTLQILESEYRALRCLCGRRLNHGRSCFTGGDILDHFYDILRADTNEVSETIERHVAVSVTVRCEEFADQLEREWGRPPLAHDFAFGADVVDLIDSFLNSNYHVIMTSDDENDAVRLAGCYEMFSSREGTLTPPLIADEESRLATDAQIRWLLRYLRNAGRWHNLCHCITTTSRARKRRLRLCLDDPVISREDVNNGDSSKLKQHTFKRTTCTPPDSSKSGMTCALDLRCARNLAPRRVASSSAGERSEVPEMETMRDSVPLVYEFTVELKVHYPAVEGTTEVARENAIMVFQTRENCLIRQAITSVTL